jgi:hypothetical protein
MGTRESYAYGTSRYLKAEALAGKTTRAIIAAVEDVEFDERGLKPVLWFEGKKRGLVVNSGNFDVLAAGIGNNTKDWPGHVIELRGEKVRFKGQLVDSIKVSVPTQTKPKQQQAKEVSPDDMDDGIPDYAA